MWGNAQHILGLSEYLRILCQNIQAEGLNINFCRRYPPVTELHKERYPARQWSFKLSWINVEWKHLTFNLLNLTYKLSNLRFLCKMTSYGEYGITSIIHFPTKLQKQSSSIFFLVSWFLTKNKHKSRRWLSISQLDHLCINS